MIDGPPGSADFWEFANSISLAAALFWVGGAFLIVWWIIKKGWPALKTFVRAVDAVVLIPSRLDAQDRLLAAQAVTMERVRAQVENSHTTNLREENDERHVEVVERIGDIARDVQSVKEDIQTLNGRDLAHTQVHIRMEDRLDRLMTGNHG